MRSVGLNGRNNPIQKGEFLLGRAIHRFQPSNYSIRVNYGNSTGEFIVIVRCLGVKEDQVDRGFWANGSHLPDDIPQRQGRL